MTSRNCSSEAEFEEIKGDYQTCLKKAGYTHVLKYNPSTGVKTKKKCRSRTITCFNLPWASNVKTNVAEKFLRLVDEYQMKFKGTPLEYIFTRATIKVANSTDCSMKAHISAHNRKILKTETQENESCNCRNENIPCPLNGWCLVKSIVYKAVVSTNQPNLKKKNIPWYDSRYFQKTPLWAHIRFCT